MKIKAAIFDFDGPLNDSFREGLRRIEILCGINKIPYTKEERKRLVKFWGLPGVELLQKGLNINKELAEVVYPQWEVFDLVNPIPLINGAREALRWNRNRKILNTLLTSRNKQNIDDIFEKLDLHREFSLLSTRQDTQFKKPDPRVFDHTLKELKEKFGVEKEECVFIGDTPEDIKCGNAAGVETVVVMTGPYWLEHLITFPVKPQNIIPSVDYFDEWVEKYQD